MNRTSPCGRVLSLLLAMTASGCGGDDDEVAPYACATLTIQGPSYDVPEQLDHLHVTLSDGEGLLTERTYLLTQELPQTLALCQGELTPTRVTLVVTGYLGQEELTQSTPVTFDFVGNETLVLTVTLP